MVLYLEFLRQGLNSVVQEMGALIAHQNYWTSKSTDDVLKEELCSCSSITISYCFGLCPSGKVFCSHDDVSRTCALSGWVDWSHKVNSPFVEYAQCDLRSQRHFIAARWFSYPLADIATSAEVLCVFMQCRPP